MLRGKRNQHDSPKNVIKLPLYLWGREIRYFRKVTFISSFPNFAFSLKGRKFKESYKKYLNE